MWLGLAARVLLKSSVGIDPANSEHPGLQLILKVRCRGLNERSLYDRRVLIAEYRIAACQFTQKVEWPGIFSLPRRSLQDVGKGAGQRTDL
jgi:hypothetical protein